MKALKSLLVFMGIFLITFVTSQAVNAEGVVDTSISGELSGTSTTSLVVVPAPGGSGKNKEYPSTAAGLKSALYDLYQYGNNSDYAMYIGTSIANLSGADAKALTGAPSATNMSFSALEGKVKTLVLTALATDPINNETKLPTGAKYITFATSAYMGSNVVFRNVDYRGTNLYMNGHDLSLNGGSYGNGFSIYGGSDTTDIVGSPTITVNSTGSGTTWNFYGGNSSSGALTGDTNLVFNNTSGAIDTISGGAKSGTINGNVNVKINDLGGRLTSYYGGGEGTAAKPSNVVGNVTNVIDNKNAQTKMVLSEFIGGINYGDVSGSISNTLQGYGSYYNTSSNFYGGSNSGNIGSASTANAITSHVDISKYTSGRGDFSGANKKNGVIKGKITNTIRAGQFNKGSFNQVNGGGSETVDRLSATAIGSSGINANNDQDFSYDLLTKEERTAKAEAAATFRIYGDIHTDILGGSVSYGGDNVAYTRAAGWAGYIRGNTSVTVGTLNEDGHTGGEGFVYSGSLSAANYNLAMSEGGIPYSHTTSRTESNGPFDIVGGGGSNTVNASEIFIDGDTSVVLNNVLARWTYGGGFSGVYQGNSSITLNGGIVSTLEGSGYTDLRRYGNPNATVNGGQIDWFLSGGGWWDNRIYGNPTVTVKDGVINASMGGTYGLDTNHRVFGNTKMLIYGGDFSGTPLKGNQGFSGGATNQGTIFGSTELTLDLRTKYASTFIFPTNTFVSAGRPYNAGGVSKLKGGEEATMTLNIYANDNGKDILNGAVVYGDGGTASSDTTNGKLNINIDAPGSTIGTLYATQYSNIAADALIRDVTVNIQRVKSLGGISGGNQTDYLNNTRAKASLAKGKSVEFNIGVPVIGAESNIFQDEPILVSGIGIINFNEITVDNGTVITASGTTGNIKNGGNALASNHSTTYNEFGNIHLKNNSGLGVLGATNFISAGKVTIEGESTLESGQGTGIINISDIEFVDSDNDRLTWIKNTSDATKMIDSDGTYFGKSKAFQVLTINPVVANALVISPFNFKGIEKSTGKTFIGDNDVTGKNGSGYGIMIPGSVIDYTITDPIVDGKGFIEHNVKEVKRDNLPLTLSVWGTEQNGVKVQKGRLIIPRGTGILPTLTFTPEENSGSWLYNTTIKSSKIGSTDEVIGEQPDSSPVDWSSKDGDYSYEVDVKYSNKVELEARNVILTETEASRLLTEADVNSYTKVAGRPFLTSTITDTLLESLRKPLDENQYSRITPINYMAGTATVNPTNTMAKEVNIIVVKDGSTVATDRQNAIFAQDVTIRVLDIANVESQKVFENDYSHAFAINTKGEISSIKATPADYFTRLQAVVPEDVPMDIPVTYSFDTESGSISKSVTIHVIPSEANLVVNFVDEVNNSLHTPITFKRNIGTTVDLTKEQEVLNAIAEVQGKNYVLETRPNPEIVPIVTGGSEVTYQFKGIIFIASAPDRIEFGTHIVKPTKQRINEPESMDRDLAIQDSRANRKPWVLTAKLDTPLNNGKDTIPGALRYVYKGKEIVLNAGAEEVAGHTNTDEKPYKVNSTWSASGDGLKLQTDIGSVKASGSYTASITWELTNAP
ncbi:MULTISPECIES: beta strand repeat-containing protein [unclassified Enterococcus]|uniref:beta strand repeat-containing protein n=1 Tax=unclassified Enterococcus TaxID=2608891 RepID=UPI001CE1DBFA|nr:MULTISPECIES: hypothetical protein [unclassified Enterococcus]MCA5011427.1 hypothetical protein [Enterococcus sp. S23]MCA5015131.1 hypothetical protein [Enterococcus sp. S22(2020)]